MVIVTLSNARQNWRRAVNGQTCDLAALVVMKRPKRRAGRVAWKSHSVNSREDNGMWHGASFAGFRTTSRV
jgi:hypothetical protein